MAIGNGEQRTRLNGLDVSHFQGNIDWLQIAKGGLSFAFVKATEGLHTFDAMFADNWKRMSGAGIIRGAYHFFHPELDGAGQARHFLATVQVVDGDMPPVIDIELSNNIPGTEIIKGVSTWLDIVSKATNRKPIIYTGPSFWNSTMNDQFGDYPLWIAQYAESPKIPKGWNDWTFWQYTEKGQIAGVGGNVDLNYFNGTIDDLKSI
jgi:lysozyme